MVGYGRLWSVMVGYGRFFFSTPIFAFRFSGCQPFSFLDNHSKPLNPNKATQPAGQPKIKPNQS
jgi:hypothetical protein